MPTYWDRVIFKREERSIYMCIDLWVVLLQSKQVFLFKELEKASLAFLFHWRIGLSRPLILNAKKCYFWIFHSVKILLEFKLSRVSSNNTRNKPTKTFKRMWRPQFAHFSKCVKCLPRTMHLLHCHIFSCTRLYGQKFLRRKNSARWEEQRA